MSVKENIAKLTFLLTQYDVRLETLIYILQKLTILMESTATRINLKVHAWTTVVRLAKRCLPIFSKDQHTSEELQLLAELFRFLRNSCIRSYDNAHFVFNEYVLFKLIKAPLSSFLFSEARKERLILKISLQLFGNILLSYSVSKLLTWGLFFEDNKFKSLIENKDTRIQQCAMMVLFNCRSVDNSIRIFSTNQGRDILISVTNALTQNLVDWGTLYLQYLLKQERFLSRCYYALPVKNRLLILDIVAEGLKTAEVARRFSIHITSIDCFKNLLLKHIIQLYTIKDSNMDPTETVKILSILCSASSLDDYILLLQKSTDLVQTSVEALKCVHILGKEGCNIFTSLSAVQDISSQFNEEAAAHPLYVCKNYLIQLLGNLCYNCRENQDLVRNLDGIPLLLDCCRFDAKNPYITERCIVSIRNLLENNPENQAVVAEITALAVGVDPNFLKEMGEMGRQVLSDFVKLRISTTSSS